MLCRWYDFYSLSMLSTGTVCGKLVWGPGGCAETGWFRTAPHASAKPHNFCGKPPKSVLRKKCSANGFCTAETCKLAQHVFVMWNTAAEKPSQKTIGAVREAYGEPERLSHTSPGPPTSVPQTVFGKARKFPASWLFASQTQV